MVDERKKNYSVPIFLLPLDLPSSTEPVSSSSDFRLLDCRVAEAFRVGDLVRAAATVVMEGVVPLLLPLLLPLLVEAAVALLPWKVAMFVDGLKVFWVLLLQQIFSSNIGYVVTSHCVPMEERVAVRAVESSNVDLRYELMARRTFL